MYIERLSSSQLFSMHVKFRAGNLDQCPLRLYRGVHACHFSQRVLY